MSYRVTVLPGDGIGPEVIRAMKQCVAATGVAIDWEEVAVGEPAIAQYGTPLPEEALASVRKNKVAIKGPITTPVGTGFRSVNVQLRQSLDLFACVRPAKTYEGVRSRYKNIDLMIFRENTEDLYAGVEFDLNAPATQQLIQEFNRLQPKQVKNDSAISIKPISVSGSRRIIKYAFESALRLGRKTVTAVHKANIMKYTDGLFLKIGREVAKEYEGRINFNDVIVDNMCMQLVQKPENFDVLVLPNLYGDIISDLCAGLIGGLGIAPGANIGDGIALFEPVHGSAPRYTGKNMVNPVATILSAVMMLEYLKEDKAAQILEKAVAEVIREGQKVTYDFKADRNDPNRVGTTEMAEAIAEKVLSLK